MSQKKPPAPPPAPAPFHAPFASLAPLKAQLPEGKPPAAATSTTAPARAVVRLERKGRGGKEVTVVEGLGQHAAVWLGELKEALGCGGTLEEGAVVLQGDQRRRVEAQLRSRGVRRISVG